MPTKDDSFIALGPLPKNAAAFQTFGTNIYQGAFIEGVNVGITAKCDKGLSAIIANGKQCPGLSAESNDRAAIEAVSTKDSGVIGITSGKLKAGIEGNEYYRRTSAPNPR